MVAILLALPPDHEISSLVVAILLALPPDHELSSLVVAILMAPPPVPRGGDSPGTPSDSAVRHGCDGRGALGE